MLTPYRYYKILLIFNTLLCSFNFETELGLCYIDKELNQKNIVQNIKSTANDLILKFGDVKSKAPFYIKKINTNTEWVRKFPNLDWAAGIATNNQIFINNTKILNEGSDSKQDSVVIVNDVLGSVGVAAMSVSSPPCSIFK